MLASRPGSIQSNLHRVSRCRLPSACPCSSATLLLAFAASPAMADDAASARAYAAVDPFIGTGGEGHTFPGAVVPFGMVQLSPDTQLKTRKEGYGWAAGYRYDDTTIFGFSHTHFSGTGHSDLGDVLVMPIAGEVKLEPGDIDQPGSGYFSRFSHDNEKAEPGYYAVTLADYGIRAELTAGERIGVHRYTFPQGKPAHVLIDLRTSMYDYPGKVLVVAPAHARGRHPDRLPRNARLGRRPAAVFRDALLDGAERPRPARHRAGHALQGLRPAGRERSRRHARRSKGARLVGVVDFPGGHARARRQGRDLAGQRGRRDRQPRCGNARLRFRCRAQRGHAVLARRAGRVRRRCTRADASQFLHGGLSHADGAKPVHGQRTAAIAGPTTPCTRPTAIATCRPFRCGTPIAPCTRC